MGYRVAGLAAMVAAMAARLAAPGVPASDGLGATATDLPRTTRASPSRCQELRDEHDPRRYAAAADGGNGHTRVIVGAPLIGETYETRRFSPGDVHLIPAALVPCDLPGGTGMGSPDRLRFESMP
jgi:hypothetical protein